VAEDHGLSDGYGSVDVAESFKLLLFRVTQDIILFDGVQRLLLSLQFDDVRLRDDPLSKVPHRLLECGREQDCKCFSPLDSYALVLMALCGDHDVGLVQHKNAYFLWLDEFELGTPVEHRPRDGLKTHILTLVSSDGVDELYLWIEFAHLLDDLPRLQSQLIRGRHTQALKRKTQNFTSV
uniref:Uncharacterized protein n=1 Tax=Periophthalmus magnuspinnatus TaxID=409849 RepID=A0A3B4A9Y3_9GOBI